MNCASILFRPTSSLRPDSSSFTRLIRSSFWSSLIAEGYLCRICPHTALGSLAWGLTTSRHSSQVIAFSIFAFDWRSHSIGWHFGLAAVRCFPGGHGAERSVSSSSGEVGCAPGWPDGKKGLGANCCCVGLVTLPEYWNSPSLSSISRPSSAPTRAVSTCWCQRWSSAISSVSRLGRSFNSQSVISRAFRSFGKTILWYMDWPKSTARSVTLIWSPSLFSPPDVERSAWKTGITP